MSTTDEICAICLESLSKSCILHPTGKCTTSEGRCQHIYHTCCINQWLINREACPLDNRPWKMAIPKSPKSLANLCRKLISRNISLTLEGIYLGSDVVTDFDWTEIRKFANKTKYLYTFKKPENISKDAIRLLEIQFKTVTVYPKIPCVE